MTVSDNTQAARAEFEGREFQVGEEYGRNGWEMDKAREDCSIKINRRITTDEMSQFRFGWAMGHSEYMEQTANGGNK